jgi:ketosteroid isomerase-like protein
MPLFTLVRGRGILGSSAIRVGSLLLRDAEPLAVRTVRKGDARVMGERSTEDELVALEHEWAQAILDSDMDKLERIVGQEYTLAANNFPGGKARLSRQEWMATVPAYEVHSYELADLVVHDYEDAAVVLAELELQATVRGVDRSGSFAVTDVWVKRDERWQVVARSSIFTPQASSA